MLEKTLSIIKPDAVSNNHIGEIINRFEKAHLKIVGIKMQTLSIAQASRFYQVHKQMPFFDELVAFMCSGASVAMILEGEDAVSKNRDLMGNTDPKKAATGTIRADFAENIDANAVHGSDSKANADIEIAFFFG